MKTHGLLVLAGLLLGLPMQLVHAGSAAKGTVYIGAAFGAHHRGGNGDRLVLVDYSATGLIGDPSTIIVSAPLANGLSGGVAVDTSILAYGFEVRR